MKWFDTIVSDLFYIVIEPFWVLKEIDVTMYMPFCSFMFIKYLSKHTNIYD